MGSFTFVLQFSVLFQVQNCYCKANLPSEPPVLKSVLFCLFKLFCFEFSNHRTQKDPPSHLVLNTSFETFCFALFHRIRCGKSKTTQPPGPYARSQNKTIKNSHLPDSDQV